MILWELHSVTSFLWEQDKTLFGRCVYVCVCWYRWPKPTERSKTGAQWKCGISNDEYTNSIMRSARCSFVAQRNVPVEHWQARLVPIATEVRSLRKHLWTSLDHSSMKCANTKNMIELYIYTPLPPANSKTTRCVPYVTWPWCFWYIYIGWILFEKTGFAFSSLMILLGIVFDDTSRTF